MPLDSLPTDAFALLGLMFVLGMRHGFDADHLAAIDGLTRLNMLTQTSVSRGRGQWSGRYAGVLFSLGHGLIVIPIALVASMVAGDAALPASLESIGVWISVALLTLLGLLNLNSALRTPSDQAVALLGWRSGALSRLFAARNGVAVVGVGALFAVSFDTMSQALLFAVLSRHYGGWPAALVMAAAFILGMLVTDGFNSWVLARLLRRADRRARVASRIMAFAVALIGLGTAAMVAASRLSASLGDWLEGRGEMIGAAIVGIVLMSFMCGLWLAPPSRRPAHPSMLDTSTGEQPQVR